eukprot:11496710-Ditylum_brightwellii.AAC.1
MKTEFMLSTEQRCCSTKTGYVWSLKLVQAAQTVMYWQTYKSNLLNTREASSHLHYLDTVLNINFETLPPEKVCSNLTKARKELKTAQYFFLFRDYRNT